jgi:hypothetical protein
VKLPLPFPNQSAIFVGIVVGFLNVLSYTPAEPTPRRLDIIFDLEMKFHYLYIGLVYFKSSDNPFFPL